LYNTPQIHTIIIKNIHAQSVILFFIYTFGVINNELKTKNNEKEHFIVCLAHSSSHNDEQLREQEKFGKLPERK